MNSISFYVCAFFSSAVFALGNDTQSDTFDRSCDQTDQEIGANRGHQYIKVFPVTRSPQNLVSIKPRAARFFSCQLARKIFPTTFSGAATLLIRILL